MINTTETIRFVHELLTPWPQLQERRPSDVFVKIQKNLLQKDDVIFTANVDYVTGGKVRRKSTRFL